MPRCSSCKQELSVDSFYVGASGRQCTCKECQRSYRKNNRERMRSYATTYNAEHAESNREYQRAYYKSNRSHVRARHKAWYEKHKESVHRRAKQWVRTHPEQTKTFRKRSRTKHLETRKATERRCSAEYRRKHPEQCLAANKRWRVNNPERVRMLSRAGTARRHAREKRLASEPVDLRRIIARDGMHCHLCGKKVTMKTLSFDHLVPVSKGGGWLEHNLAVSHLRCNQRRGAKGGVQLKLVV